MNHEFHSLSLSTLDVVRGGTHEHLWKPRAAGIELSPDRRRPSPCRLGRAAARGRCGAMAREFSAATRDAKDNRWELRLLSQPLYRYESTDPDVLDGALFAFVTSAGTDPEALLVIEARRPPAVERRSGTGRSPDSPIWTCRCGTRGWRSSRADSTRGDTAADVPEPGIPALHRPHHPRRPRSIPRGRKAMKPDAREETPASPCRRWTWRTTRVGADLVRGRVRRLPGQRPRDLVGRLGSGEVPHLRARPRRWVLPRPLPGASVLKWWPSPSMPYYVTMVDGHYVSHYPIGPAFVALPFTMPQMLFLDWARPGWETSDPKWFDTIAKRSAAAITTLAALALLAVLRKLGLGRVAWLAALAAALGSNLWCTASQSLWQHGPAALMLTLLCAAALARIAIAAAVRRGRTWRRGFWSARARSISRSRS